jgi:predicted TIM-barrel fold metal-dependent hydrolase
LQDSSLIKYLLQVNAISSDGASAKDSILLNADSLITEMNKAHVDKAIILSSAYMFGSPALDVQDEYEKVQHENDWTGQQAALYPQRLEAYCSVNPLKDYAVDEIKRCAASKKFAGLKLHFTNSGIDLRNSDHVKKLQAIFGLVDSLRMPVTVHMRTYNKSYGARDAGVFINDLLLKTKHIPVQVAHMAGWGGYDKVTDAALQVFVDAFNNGTISRGNIYFDISALLPATNELWSMDVGDIKSSQKKNWNAKAALTKKIGQIGINNILFGSDYPVISLANYIRNLEATLGVQTTQDILKNKLPAVN